MFGYLSATAELLTEEQFARYRACYCGLCRSLKERHGQFSRLTLNYDMTFLVLLLSSLYEPEEQGGDSVCIAHPFKSRKWQKSELTDYAADMNLALAYHKCRDDWHDDRKVLALAEAAALKRGYKRVEKNYPVKCTAIEKAMAELLDIERTSVPDVDAAAAAFGSLMGELLVFREDRWSEILRFMGNALGRFIYVMDACMDLEDDVKQGNFNPFRSRYGLGNNEQYFRDILKMLLGECLFHFDRLPLVQDIGILQNILCAGLWVQFDKKYSDKKEPSDVSGSV